MNPLLVKAAAQTAVEHRRVLLKASLTVLTFLIVAGVAAVYALTAAVTAVVSSQDTPAARITETCVGAPTVASGVFRNVQIIATTGASMGVPRAGWVIATATTLVESGGRNLASRAVPESANYPNDGTVPGDHDSVGLFQQRASWGSVAERMDPATSARLFYQRLLQVPGWEQMDPGAAAQAVQVSAFPDRYATKMAQAQSLLSAAPMATPCATPAGGGGTFTDGTGTFTLPRANPRSTDAAIAWARAEAASGNGGWYRRCLAFVAEAYGWGGSGVLYAIDKYTVDTPVEMRHDGDRNPPPGALLFWTTSSRAGHVALSVGNGQVASNDIVTDGQISIVPAGEIESRWGAHYVGWAPPYFPHGG